MGNPNGGRAGVKCPACFTDDAFCRHTAVPCLLPLRLKFDTWREKTIDFSDIGFFGTTRPGRVAGAWPEAAGARRRGAVARGGVADGGGLHQEGERRAARLPRCHHLPGSAGAGPASGPGGRFPCSAGVPAVGGSIRLGPSEGRAALAVSTCPGPPGAPRRRAGKRLRGRIARGRVVLVAGEEDRADTFQALHGAGTDQPPPTISIISHAETPEIAAELSKMSLIS